MFELPLDEARNCSFDLEASHRRNLGTVAFRHTNAMVHVIPMLLNSDVQDLNADGRERSDERTEYLTLGGKPNLDE